MRMLIANLVNYLTREHGVEVYINNSDWDRTIDLVKRVYGYERTAYIIAGIDQGYIDWIIVKGVCARLGVEPPPLDYE